MDSSAAEGVASSDRTVSSAGEGVSCARVAMVSVGSEESSTVLGDSGAILGMSDSSARDLRDDRRLLELSLREIGSGESVWSLLWPGGLRLAGRNSGRKRYILMAVCRVWTCSDCGSLAESDGVSFIRCAADLWADNLSALAATVAEISIASFSASNSTVSKGGVAGREGSEYGVAGMPSDIFVAAAAELCACRASWRVFVIGKSGRIETSVSARPSCLTSSSISSGL